VAAEPLRLTLVSGPARSGKSRWAEHLAAGSGRRVVYLATGPRLPGDAAWQARIARHRRRRPAGWDCQEVEGALAAALERLSPPQLGLVDSLGTWVAAHLEREGEEWRREVETLERALEGCAAPLVLVAEEVGWGVVPATAAGGRFRDRLGNLLDRLVPRCDAAWLVIHGRALDLLAQGRAVPPAAD
jgi:adenosylcobinamide kinase/adenosylcobinamide-phosphate guanylyltransferase